MLLNKIVIKYNCNYDYILYNDYINIHEVYGAKSTVEKRESVKSKLPAIATGSNLGLQYLVLLADAVLYCQMGVI